jgi:hypothetical protein
MNIILTEVYDHVFRQLIVPKLLKLKFLKIAGALLFKTE